MPDEWLRCLILARAQCGSGRENFLERRRLSHPNRVTGTNPKKPHRHSLRGFQGWLHAPSVGRLFGGDDPTEKDGVTPQDGDLLPSDIEIQQHFVAFGRVIELQLSLRQAIVFLHDQGAT